MRRRRRSALFAALCSLALPAVAAADSIPAGSKTVTAGPVTATLTWQAGEQVGTHSHLQITREGTTVLDADMDKQCQLCGSVDPRDPLRAVDLDGDAEPEVLVDFYSGGAHCCGETLIWYLADAATGTYGHQLLGLGDQIYSLKDLDGDGKPEIVTADDSFAYEFTAFAFDWFPPLVYDWRGHALVDVTRQFPDVVRADLVKIRKALPKLRRDDPRGAVAAYVADLFLLGRRDDGLAYLRSALRRRDLRAVPPGDQTWPAGRRFAPALLRFLKHHGYG